MNYKHILILTIVVLSLPYCIIHKKEKYNIPESLSSDSKEEIIKIIEKGKILYKQNCSSCHGIFTKGKDGIPNFTTTQLDKYTTRFIMQDPKNHAIAFKMHPEQLHEVLTFLRYRIIKGDTTRRDPGGY